MMSGMAETALKKGKKEANLTKRLTKYVIFCCIQEFYFFSYIEMTYFATFFIFKYKKNLITAIKRPNLFLILQHNNNEKKKMKNELANWFRTLLNRVKSRLINRYTL